MYFFFTVNFWQFSDNHKSSGWLNLIWEQHLLQAFYFPIIYTEWNQNESGCFSLQLQFISLNFTTQRQTAGMINSFLQCLRLGLSLITSAS